MNQSDQSIHNDQNNDVEIEAINPDRVELVNISMMNRHSSTLENSVERKVISNQHDHHRADKRASVTREAMKMANVEKFSL